MATLIPNYALAEIIGEKIEIDAGTVDELIREGIARYGEPFKKAIAHAAIAVNGRTISYLKGKKTKLQAADTVWLILPASGG